MSLEPEILAGLARLGALDVRRAPGPLVRRVRRSRADPPPDPMSECKGGYAHPSRTPFCPGCWAPSAQPCWSGHDGWRSPEDQLTRGGADAYSRPRNSSDDFGSGQGGCGVSAAFAQRAAVDWVEAVLGAETPGRWTPRTLSADRFSATFQLTGEGGARPHREDDVVAPGPVGARRVPGAHAALSRQHGAPAGGAAGGRPAVDAVRTGEGRGGASLTARGGRDRRRHAAHGRRGGPRSRAAPGRPDRGAA